MVVGFGLHKEEDIKVEFIEDVFDEGAFAVEAALDVQGGYP